MHLLSLFRSWLFLLLFLSLQSIEAKEISAYYEAPYTNLQTVEKKLSDAGFIILSTYSPAQKSYLHVVTFTNKELIALASKKRRGFAAVEKLIVNTKTKHIRLTNPSFWLRAFLQTDYHEGSEESIVTSLKTAFGSLKITEDSIPQEKIASYRFTEEMPSYIDMLTFEDNGEIRKEDILFELNLQNGATLIGITMPKSVESFIKITGEENALLLPYLILREENKIFALDGKYYIAISYLRLNMESFIKMRSTPDKIRRAIKHLVRKNIL